MTNQELYQEENRQLLKTIAIGIDDFKKVLQGQIDITVNQPDKMTVNTEKSVEVTNLEQMKEWVDNLGTVVTKAIEDNSYKPVSEVSIKNAKDIIPDKLTISNLSDIKTYFSDVTRAIKNNQPIVNITKQEVVFPKSPKDAIPVRLSDGKSFYNAIATAISSASNGQAHLHVGGSPVTTANPVPVDIQDASVTINGDVTVSSEVEVKNDSGNPVPVTDSALAGYVDGIEAILNTIQSNGDTVETKLQSIADNTDGLEGFVDGIEGLLTSLNGYVDGLETLITATNSSVDGLEGFTDGLEGLITTLNGYVDGLETLVASTNTKLDTINTTLGTTLGGYMDQLEGYTDGLEALITSTNGYVDQLEGYLDTVETKLQSVIDNTAQVSATMDHGSNRDIDTTAEQITSTSFACKFGVTLKADITNTGIIYIGNSDVTAGTTAATDGFPLSAGETLTLEVNNSNIPYAIASANNQIIYWAAV